MTDVVCTMEDCIHRSKRAMRRFGFKDGKKCYKCTLEAVVIRNLADQEVYDVLGKELPCCNRYERKED